jgi:hypothetical protein
VAIASRHGLSAADRAACRALVRALPRTLAGELRRSVDPDDALGAAWGDPAYVLRCGVSMPSSFDRFSTCEVANGVGWFAPPSQAGDQAVDVSLTTVGWSPAVSILVPAAGRPEGVAAAIAALAAPVKRHLRKVKDCG